MRVFWIIALSSAACGYTPGQVAPDGKGSAAPHKQIELVSGGGRTTAGTVTIDVQIGRAVPIVKSTAGTFTISGAPTVQP